jgi:hypothetical protein
MGGEVPDKSGQDKRQANSQCEDAEVKSSQLRRPRCGALSPQSGNGSLKKVNVQFFEVAANVPKI